MNVSTSKVTKIRFFIQFCHGIRYFYLLFYVLFLSVVSVDLIVYW
nr:MAG TPA: hypothetical protein [Caudoviricetes sp.]